MYNKMSIFNEKNTLRKILRYVFYVTLILRALTSVYVWYQYIMSSSKQVISKWGTFVEWIFNTTSFLPYLNNDWQSKFYQWFLFDKCLAFSVNEKWEVVYEDKLCHVTTKDYKTYYVTVWSGMIWSDWVPFSIDDVYFTYHDILQENKLGLSYLEKYSTIETTLDGDKVQVVFKNTSQDNTSFFTNYILPKHALIEPTLDQYQQSFAIEPVYNNCAKIKSQSTDQYSLIFDLSNCENTNIGFYQIKNTISFDNFKESVAQSNGSIIDVYMGEETLPGYSKVNINSNSLISVFFNTKSPKMTVRLRRALGGFIHSNFFDGSGNDFVSEYKWEILNQFLSTWSDIQTFLSRVKWDSSLGKQELIEWGVTAFTGNVNFTEKNKVFAFYTEEASQSFAMKFTFETPYKKIAISYGTSDLYFPSSYSEKTKSAQYNISLKNNNLKSGLNTYIIYGFTGDSTSWKKLQIWTINLYNLYHEWMNDEWEESNNIETLKVIYFDNTVSNYVVWRLKQIFMDAGIQDFFTYVQVSDANELEWKLTAGEYDIVINTIDMWLNKDISALFATEATVVNPTQYTDARLLSLLKQYNESSNNSKIVGEINGIYANDMPMVIIGKQQLQLNVKDTIMNKLDWENMNLYEYDWRDIIFKNISLTENIYIDKEKVKSLNNFWKFINDPENY